MSKKSADIEIDPQKAKVVARGSFATGIIFKKMIELL